MCSGWPTPRWGRPTPWTRPGRPIDTAQGKAVWPGGTYFTAALMHTVGVATGRSDLVADALTTGYGVYRTTYDDDRTAFWFDTPALWIPDRDPDEPRPVPGRRPTSGAGRRGSCSWPSRTRSRWVGSPRCEPAAGSLEMPVTGPLPARHDRVACRDLLRVEPARRHAHGAACSWPRPSSATPTSTGPWCSCSTTATTGRSGSSSTVPRPSRWGRSSSPGRTRPSLAPPGVVFRGGPVSPDAVIGLARAALPRGGAGTRRGAPSSTSVGTVDLSVPPDAQPVELDGARLFSGYCGVGARPARGASWPRGRGSCSTRWPTTCSVPTPRPAVARRHAPPGRELSLLAAYPPHPSLN